METDRTEQSMDTADKGLENLKQQVVDPLPYPFGIQETGKAAPLRGASRETTRLLSGPEPGSAVHFYYCGSESCTPGHFFGPAVRPHYLIHFIRSGKGRYLRREEAHALAKGDAFLILPGETTKYIADEQDPWEYTWIAFDGPGAKALLGSCRLGESNVTYHSPTPEAADHLLSMASLFETSFQDEKRNSLEIIGNFFLLFSCMYQEPDTFSQLAGLSSSNDTQGSSSLASQELYFRQAAAYLNHNYSYPVKVEQLARQIGVSRSYLYRAFKNCAHQSIQQYLLTLRLKEARRLLRDTNRQITDIAYSCGFTDSPSFCRQFRKACGLSPLQFRRKMCKSSPSQPSQTSL